MEPTAKAIYKKLASMVATKHNQSYSQTISWLQCRLSFSLLRSTVMCLRGFCRQPPTHWSRNWSGHLWWQGGT